jgi:hypothetical protein
LVAELFWREFWLGGEWPKGRLVGRELLGDVGEAIAVLEVGARFEVGGGKLNCGGAGGYALDARGDFGGDADCLRGVSPARGGGGSVDVGDGAYGERGRGKACG